MRTKLTAGAIALACATHAVAETPAERGEYLVRGPMGCGNCHTPQDADGPLAGMELAGALAYDGPEFTAYAPNITPAGRISGWTDAELARAVREGLRPDGTLIGPPMPFTMYRGLSDADLAAVVAFLRTVPAVEREVPASVYRIPLPPVYGPPVGRVAAPERGATAEYGGYLANAVAHCMECHTPMGPQGPMLDAALGQGGFEFHGPWGVSVAPNLTNGPDGLAGFSDAEIATMIAAGRRPDGAAMLPPMPYRWLKRMTPGDLEAVVLYLRTLPPLPDKG